MGDILFTIAARGSKTRADDLFRRGLAHAERIKSRTPRRFLEGSLANVAVFARSDNSGGAIARDEEDWLVACGSWFHRDGFATGDERRLLLRIREMGPLTVARELDGFYVIVCGDRNGREVRVLTDVMGSRHCFVREFGDCLAVSTSSLLLASLCDAPLDWIGCEEFLRFGVIYEDRTLFRDVRKLAPGSVFRFKEGRRIESLRYWQMSDLDPYALQGDSATEQLCERLVDAARRIGNVYSRPVCDLTGGYDSRLVVAAFMSAGVPFETTVSGPAESQDVLISKRLSKLTLARHWHNEPDSPITPDGLKEALSVTDGECDLVEYSRIQKIHRCLLEKFDVSVNGSYGETCRGYWWELLTPRIGKCEPLDARELAQKRYAAVGDSVLFPPGEGLDVIEHLAAIISRCNRDLAGWPNTAQMDNAYLMLRMQRWQGRIASSTDQIRPCLSPFLFRSVLEAALQTEARYRKRSRLTRAAMARLQPALAAEPLDAGYPPLPVTMKTWMQFIPAVAQYSEKIWNKAAGAATPFLTDESARSELWRDEEIHEILAPATMRLNDLIERRHLEDFLESSRQKRFAFDLQWRRLLSVEIALQLLRSIKKMRE